jgi:hypothetical protein
VSRVYIAGPMTGIPDHNYPAFAYAATVLRAQGRDVSSPHEIDGGSVGSQTWEWYMRRALQMLLDCDEIVLLPGWEQSKGARFERELAEVLGMPVSEWAGSSAA